MVVAWDDHGVGGWRGEGRERERLAPGKKRGQAALMHLVAFEGAYLQLECVPAGAKHETLESICHSTSFGCGSASSTILVVWLAARQATWVVEAHREPTPPELAARLCMGRQGELEPLPARCRRDDSPRPNTHEHDPSQGRRRALDVQRNRARATVPGSYSSPISCSIGVAGSSSARLQNSSTCARLVRGTCALNGSAW